MATLLKSTKGKVNSWGSSTVLDYSTVTWLENDGVECVCSAVTNSQQSQASNQSWKTYGSKRQSFDFTTATSIARSARAAGGTPSMVARQFDGPGSPAFNLGSLKKRNGAPKQAKVDTSYGIGFNSEVSELNFRTMGYDYSTSASPPIPSKSPAHAALVQTLKSTTKSKGLEPSSRIPVPDGQKLLKDNSKRSSVIEALEIEQHSLHIPGSYISAKSSTTALKTPHIISETARAYDVGSSIVDETESLMNALGNRSSTSEASNGSLNSYPKGSFPKEHPTIQVPFPNQKVGNNLLSSFYSTRSGGTPHHFLLKTSADPSLSEFPAPPIVTYVPENDFQPTGVFNHNSESLEGGSSDEVLGDWSQMTSKSSVRLLVSANDEFRPENRAEMDDVLPNEKPCHSNSTERDERLREILLQEASPSQFSEPSSSFGMSTVEHNLENVRLPDPEELQESSHKQIDADRAYLIDSKETPTLENNGLSKSPKNGWPQQKSSFSSRSASEAPTPKISSASAAFTSFGFLAKPGNPVAKLESTQSNDTYETTPLHKRKASPIASPVSPRSYRASPIVHAFTENDPRVTNSPNREIPRHWIKQIISKGLSSVSSTKKPAVLTMLPTKSSRAKSVPLQRSYGPGIGQTDWYVSEQSPFDHPKVLSRTEELRNIGGEDLFEPFNKVILDLEALLAEALVLTKLATEKSEQAELGKKSVSYEKSRPNADADKINLESGHQMDQELYYSSETDRSSASVDTVELVELLRDRLKSSESQNQGGAIGKSARVKNKDSGEKPNHEWIGKEIEDRPVTMYSSSPKAFARHQSLFPETSKPSTSRDELPLDFPANSIKIAAKNLKKKVELPDSTYIDPDMNKKSDLYWSPFEGKRDHAFVARSPSSTSNIQTPSRFYPQSDAAMSAGQEATTQKSSDTVVSHFSVRQASDLHQVFESERKGLVRYQKAQDESVLNERSIREHVRRFKEPPINPRTSSNNLFRKLKHQGPESRTSGHYQRNDELHEVEIGQIQSVRSPGLSSISKDEQQLALYHSEKSPRPAPGAQDLPNLTRHRHITHHHQGLSLRDRHHFSIKEPQGFSLSRSHRRQPIARDWGVFRKRFVAAVACLNTALIGLIIGVYAGEVPAIQYQIVDFHHYANLGNVFLYLCLAIPTFIFWPLPLLHGRKPYTLGALALLIPLQIPQAISVTTARSPYVSTYRVSLLLARGISGLVLGFANINFKATLLDLFGSSLQSGNPHQEILNQDDVRRHGGGMGVWLGIWSCCYIGSVGIGFLIGANIINDLNPSWGFWIILVLIAFVLLLNIVTPEVRRSPYRRSVAQVVSGTTISRRVARGEIMMHIKSTGPIWWWEEVNAGLILSWRMLKQPGFFILSLYVGWIYGQMVIVVVLLGALISRYYQFQPPSVGFCVAAVPIGALLAIPFQKASFFSRSRHHPARTDSMTFQRQVTWTSHLLRRTVFMVLLPFAVMAYTLSSGGPPTGFIVPTFFAASIGFFSNLAIAESSGLIMETYDTSDLQPGMTGRKFRRQSDGSNRKKRTNYSCFPRVSAAFAITQSIGFVLAAIATSVGGTIERRIGTQSATGIVAGFLLILTLMLVSVLWRWSSVQVIPDSGPGPQFGESSGTEWIPVIIGNPSGKLRRMSVLEMGSQSRWTEIRRKNRLL